MSNTKTQLGNSIVNSLIKLKQDKGEDIKIEDFAQLFEDMASSMDSQENQQAIVLKSEIGKLASYIKDAKIEIAALSSNDEMDVDNTNISNATDHLSAVVEATENATNEIMDKAEEISNIVDAANDENTAEQVNDKVAKIYEACNFQDLTGQRINKVIAMVEHIEEKINNLVGIFGESEMDSEMMMKMQERLQKSDPLMAGPQLSSEAPTQDDIDKLFDSLGGDTNA